MRAVLIVFSLWIPILCASWTAADTNTDRFLIDFRDAQSIEQHRPILAAHRGGVVTEKSSECSLTAIRLAAKLGYDLVEVDVQRSRDGVPIVFHDNTLDKACGREESVSELNATDLEQIHYLKGDDKIARLETALTICRDLKIGVMLDLKAGRESRDFLESIDALIVRFKLENASISFSGSDQARMHLKHVRFTPTDDEMRRLRAGESIDLSNRFWFGLPSRLLDDDITKLHKARALIIPAINTFRYPADKHKELARRDVERLTKAGVHGFQIDSVYFDLFTK
ncbi:MAG: hypothetical protein KDB27_25480 [Planctomycetales bacterium]|nr:hypothetical protein [Planctomycetales bacterium]